MMENAHLPLDIYPVIISYVDWKTLTTLLLVCKDLYHMSNSEIHKRLESEYPLGSQHSSIVMKIIDYQMETVHVKIDNRFILLPKNYHGLMWCRHILLKWFMSIHSEWIQKYKLFKDIIGILNNEEYEDDIELLQSDMNLEFRVIFNSNGDYESRLISVQPLE